jgi:S-adenosylmethionine:tRNA ribosyltransferase-isomerase
MMVLDPVAQSVEHSSFPTLVDRLSPDDVLVLNDTEVIPARIVSEPKGNMKKGIELLLTRRIAPLRWEAMCRPAKRVRQGDRLAFSPRLAAVALEKNEDGTIVFQFDGDPDEALFWSELNRVGITPLPPYIRRDEPREGDRAAYQTVYAASRGAVAAPTAGLHFTREVLERLDAKGVRAVRLTLHVGVGTFKPVTVDNVGDHVMDAEWFTIPEATAAEVSAARAEGRRVVAVGTTSVRALESSSDEAGVVRSGDSSTRLFITPGYRFRVVDALLTNFHLPESTLLMLVSAFAGTEFVRSAYAEAIRERYQFYSFGDCMYVTRRAQ